jgi:D-alanyl-D-alanine carboxypeptidase
MQSTLDYQKNYRGIIGVSAALVLPDGSIWAGTSGQNTSDPTVLLRTDHLLGMGSVSKTITATAILKLKEDGLLLLSDRLSKWSLAFNFVDSTITVRQLLNHTSGIYNYTDNVAFADSVRADFARVWKPEEVLTKFLKPRLFAPGASWSYSNSNYVLLGLIIERASGKPYHEYVRTNILEKAGLPNISLFPNEQPNLPIADLWADLLGIGVPIDLREVSISMNGLFSAAWSAGAFLSTPSDIGRFMWLLQRGDMLSSALLADMRTTVAAGPGYRYGLGMIEATLNSKKVFGHDGDIIYKASVYYSPSDDVAIAVQTNDGTETAITNVASDMFKTYLNYKATLSGKEPDSNPAFYISPNPFSDELAVHIDLQESANLQMQIFNSTGSRLIGWDIEIPSGKQTMQVGSALAHFPKGIYYLKVNGAGQQGVYKLVKK